MLKKNKKTKRNNESGCIYGPGEREGGAETDCSSRLEVYFIGKRKFNTQYGEHWKSEK